MKNVKVYSPAWGEGMGEDVSEKGNFEELGLTPISEDAFPQAGKRLGHCKTSAQGLHQNSGSF